MICCLAKATNPDPTDKDLLVAILRFALPRKSLKPSVDALLTRFGSAARVIGAPTSALHSAVGLGEAGVSALKTIHAAALRVLYAKVIGRSVVEFHSALIDYLTVAMAYESNEQVRVVFIDYRQRFLADEVVFQGTIDLVPAYPREIVLRTLERRAPAMIVVHNHPSGDPNPSSHDIRTTFDLEVASTAVGLDLFDHLIIGATGWYSFRKGGYITKSPLSCPDCDALLGSEA